KSHQNGIPYDSFIAPDALVNGKRLFGFEIKQVHAVEVEGKRHGGAGPQAFLGLDAGADLLTGDAEIGHRAGLAMLRLTRNEPVDKGIIRLPCSLVRRKSIAKPA
ncbi:hypothetical protein V6766_17700, partial [Martelella sp. AMO21009]